MAKLSLNHIYKTYPNGLKAVNDFNLEIKDGEFVVFVGPSGCGKSTTLRMIAGLEEITAGSLYIDDKLVNFVEPKNRDIAMVFQNYALYPHLNVYENIAFGLKLRHTPKEEVKKKVNAAAEMLGLTEYLNKKPAAMSGGQRQRVALGRALVREPKVFLLDEPLSNLDAKLRGSMRGEITKLHEKLGTTFVYVTHDQVEAMTMGDRIVVMKLGYVQQIDTPKNLYRYPVNKFVAGFIGTPQMNFTDSRIYKNKEGIVLSFEGTDTSFVLPFDYLMKVDPIYFDNKHPVSFALRCEHVSIHKKSFEYSCPVKVARVEELGTEKQIFANFDTKSDVLLLSDNDETSKINIVFKTDADYQVRIGDIIDISMDLNRLHLFDSETEEVINPRVPNHGRVNGKVKNGVLEMFGLKIKLPSAIKLDDGDDYQVYIPSKALSISDKGFDFEVYSCEKIEEQYLLILKQEDEVLFLLSDVEKKKGESIKVSFDLKYFSFYKDGNKVLDEMKEINEIAGMVYFHKEKDSSTGKKVKVLDYLIDDLAIPVKENKIAYRVFIENNDRSLYDIDFGFRFKPNQIHISDEGELTLKPIEILDYGKDKYLKCSFKDTELLMLIKDTDIDFSKEIKATIDIDEVEVFDIEKDIRFA